jgi:site-specific recombinase XerD
MLSEELEKEHLHKALEKYKGSYAVEQGLSQATRKNRRNFLLRLEKFLADKSFSLETTREFIDSLRTTEKGTSASISTVQTYIRNVTAFCQFLVDEEFISTNFCKKIKKLRKEQRRMELISEEKAYKVIITGTTPGRGDRVPSIRKKKETRAALLFILSTGRRISEVLRMKGSDLSLDDDPPSYEVIQKGRREPQPFEVPPNMIGELRKRQGKNKVFNTSAEACNIALKRGLKSLGIDRKITAHRLRDIFSVTRLRNDVPLQKVSRLLGHKNSLITDEYYSDFIMTDLSEGLRTSKIVSKGTPLPNLFDDTEKSIRKMISDDRLTMSVDKGETEMVIRIAVKNA